MPRVLRLRFGGGYLWLCATTFRPQLWPRSPLSTAGLPGALSADGRFGVDCAELGRVANGVDPRDPPAFDHEADRSVVPVIGADDPGPDRTVEQRRQDRGVRGEPAERPQE